MIQPGTLLQNRYRVSEQIGKGGMGEVYLATDERFQSTVAVKRTYYGEDDQEMHKAFKREARLLNHLRHNALPKVSDHFSEDGSQFLVMEFIEGTDLGELLTRRKAPFPPSDVLRWADELLDALEYLHTFDPPVVHRDIKPPNIKLTPRGKVVLLDFGLAKGTPAQTTAAAASSVYGFSLNFAPLEQMQGSGTDQRSDLYSLAATLYSLLTGIRPPDAVARASATIKEQPDPLRPAHLVQAQVPAAVGQILQRAMSQNPALRYASAAEMRAALRLAARDVAAREKKPKAAAAEVTPHGDAAPAESPVPSPSAHGSQSIMQAAKPLKALHSISAPGDATRVDSYRPTRPYDTLTVVAGDASEPEGTPAKKILGLVACLLVVCAAAYLIVRASGSSAPAAGAGAEAQSSAPVNPQTLPAETEAAAAGKAASDSTQVAPVSNAPAESAPARPAVETPASSPQASAGASSAPDQAAQQVKGSAATPDGASMGDASSSAGRPGLVIQNPIPANSPASQTRRVEEPRREPEYHPEYDNRPPPGPGYPPPNGGRRPPPPDGRRPPPPFRRP
ncbi:MAG TPA: protein kinase [Pyrinomonadaceae bacterium]